MTQMGAPPQGSAGAGVGGMSGAGGMAGVAGGMGGGMPGMSTMGGMGGMAAMPPNMGGLTGTGNGGKGGIPSLACGDIVPGQGGGHFGAPGAFGAGGAPPGGPCVAGLFGARAGQRPRGDPGGGGGHGARGPGVGQSKDGNGCFGGKGGFVGKGGGPASVGGTITQQPSINGLATWTYGQQAKDRAQQGKGGNHSGAGRFLWNAGFSMKGGGLGGAGGDRAAPGAHSNVFVGNLPDGTTQEALHQVFAVHGLVNSCSVMTKAGRTFGFVKYAAITSAARAIAALNGKAGWLVKFANNDACIPSTGPPRGGVGASDDGKGGDIVDHTNVFVGGLAEGFTQERLQALFSPHGKIKSCLVSKKGDQTYGLVEFFTIREARAAVQQLSGQAGMVVQFANNDARLTGWGQSPPHSNVFVGNVSQDVDTDMLQQVFSEYGSIVSTVLHADLVGSDGASAPDGKRYGFVKFATIAAAARAIEALDGHNGWSVNLAHNDAGASGKGGKGGYQWWDDWSWNTWGGTGGGWVWQPSERPSREPDRPEPPQSDNLYVRDLPPGITDDEIHATFSKVGSVVESRVLRWDNASGCSALVRMASPELAARARAQLSGTVHESCLQPLSVALQEKRGEKVEDHLYIKGLHCTSTTDQLRKLFGRFGVVKWCRILPLPFQPRGSSAPDVAALVQMGSAQEAQLAIAGLNGCTPSDLGQPMTVRFAESKQATSDLGSKPNNNIYVKGWPVGFPDFLLQRIFQQFGCVFRLRLLDNPDPEQPTCAALVQMVRIEEASRAIQQLHGRTVQTELPPMHVRYAGKEQDQSDNLYVTSLPRTITESQLRQTFQKYGEIKRLRLLQQPGSHENHALVQLSSPQVAAAARRELDGTLPAYKGPTLYVTYAAKREGRS